MAPGPGEIIIRIAIWIWHFYFQKNIFSRKIALSLESSWRVKLEELLQLETDVVILNQAPPLLKYQVIKYGRVIGKCGGPVANVVVPGSIMIRVPS